MFDSQSGFLPEWIPTAGHRVELVIGRSASQGRKASDPILHGESQYDCFIGDQMFVVVS